MTIKTKPSCLRIVAAVGFWGSVAMAGVPLSCASHRLEPIRVSQGAGGILRPNLPDIVLEKAQWCGVDYGMQLKPGQHTFKSTVVVNENRNIVGVTIEGLPVDAYDWGACLRTTFLSMPIAEKPFQQALEILKYRRDHASDGQESLEGFLEVISGVPIVDAEMVLNAEGYTIELPVTVKVQADLDTLIETDERTLQKIGQMALDSLGYEEIMRRAEQVGWVETVPIEPEQALSQSAANKQFIGDVSPSPARLPPPPPPSVITKTVTKKVVTNVAPRVVVKVAPRIMVKVLPVAAAAAAADGPLPIGDIIAVGSLAVALIAELTLDPEELLVANRSQANGLTAAASAAAAPTSALQPAPTTGVNKRRHPYQTCENDELDRLEAAKKAVCPEEPKTFPGRPCHHERKKDKALAEKYPCSLILARIAAVNTCVAARQKVQDVCFKGSPDTGHPQQIADLARGNLLCEALKAINCAPGHPMSGL